MNQAVNQRRKNGEDRTMALGFYFGQSGLDVDKYNECIKRLKKAGAAHPTGRSYHSAFGPPDKLMIFDVWTSQAAFDKFGKTLMPILKELGAEPAPPTVMQIHNVIKPPAARAKKRAPAKRAAMKRGGKRR
jgi:hypothetical protein